MTAMRSGTPISAPVDVASSGVATSDVPTLRVSSRRITALLVIVGTCAVAAACGGGDDIASIETLPPIRTTTTTSTTTTVVDDNTYLFEVRPGDTLSDIAAQFSVRVSDLVELNALEDASAIRAGQIIEIPKGFVIVTLPPRETIATG